MNQNEAYLLKMYRALLNGKLQVKTTVSGWADTNSMILNSGDDFQNYYRSKPEPIIRYIASWEDEYGVLQFSNVYVTKENLESSTARRYKNFKIHELNHGE